MNIARYIDHTLLKPEATRVHIEQLCNEALEYHFAAVCVNPVYTKQVAQMLKGSGVATATVTGFPLGASTTATKVSEVTEAVANGATEIDMVMAIGLFKGKDYKATQSDITEVVRAAPKCIVKVILETCLLSPEEIRTACRIVANAGAHYVKTSTGFNSRGATLEDIKIMKEAVGDRVKVKASGGIRTREQALAMIEAGASRIGTSAGVTIVGGK